MILYTPDTAASWSIASDPSLLLAAPAASGELLAAASRGQTPGELLDGLLRSGISAAPPVPRHRCDGGRRRMRKPGVILEGMSRERLLLRRRDEA